MTARRPIRLALIGVIAASLVACGGTDGPARSAGVDRKISATSYAHSAPPTAPTGEPQPPLAGRVIVIDPGHNGRNADHIEEMEEPVDAGGFTKPCNTVGAQSDSGYLEATFNWKVAVALEDLLRDEGARVVLSRPSNDGWGPCIDQRGRSATKTDADILVSVHADGNESPTARGFHVISPGKVAGYTEDTFRESALIAQAVRDALVDAGFTASTYEGSAGLVTRTDLGTLNHAGVPAVLVECGNLRNEDDAGLLESSTGQEQIARALADGIVRYLSG